MLIRPDRFDPNPLKLETRRRCVIDNFTRSSALTGAERWACEVDIKNYVFDRKNVRPGCDAGYNCHGMVFAARRAWVDRPETVEQILIEDGYGEVADFDLLPGDVAVYRDLNGDALHSGIVVEVPINGAGLLPNIKVWSKWGVANEVIHPLKSCPYPAAAIQFYRPRGADHVHTF